MSLASMCRTYCQKQRHVIAKDSSGGMTMPSWSDDEDSVGCDVQTAKASTLIRYSQMQIQVTNTIYLTDDLGLLAGDRVAVNDPRTEDVLRIFKVQGYGLSSVGYEEWPYMADVVEERQS